MWLRRVLCLPLRRSDQDCRHSGQIFKKMQLVAVLELGPSHGWMDGCALRSMGVNPLYGIFIGPFSLHLAMRQRFGQSDSNK